MTVDLTSENLGPETVLVAAVGELDIYTAPAFREEIARALENDAVRVLVVDLTQTSFVDSSALGVLIGALRRIRERDGHVRIAIPVAPVRKVFEITSLDQVFELYPSREAALTSS
jgi:anti-sigma B factor antagonist